MSMLFKRIRDWAVSITSFRTGDVLPVDGPSGTAKIPYSDLAKEVIKDSANNTTATEADLVAGSKLPIMTANGPKALPGNAIAKASEQTATKTYAQNVAHSIAPEFDPTRDSEHAYKAGESVTHTDGKTYVFKVDHIGVWNDADVYLYDDISKKLIDVTDKVFGKDNYGYYPLSNTSTGYYYDSNGTLVENSGSSYEEITFGANAEGKKLIIEIDPTTGASDSRCYVLYDGDGNKMTYISNGTIHTLYNNRYESSGVIHSGCKLKCSWTSGKLLPDVKVYIGQTDGLVQDLSALASRVEDTEEGITDIEKEINGYTEYHSADLSNASTGYYYDSDGNLVSNASSSYKETTLDAYFENKKLIIEIDPTTSNTDARCFVLLDENGNKITNVTNFTIHNVYNNRYESSSVVHSGWKVKCSWTTSKTTPQVKCIAVEEKSIDGKVASTYIKYVATDGLDTNDGSEVYPVKTISKAVELGAETIIVAGGVYSDDSLDLSTSLHDKVTIKGKRGESVVFKRASSLVLNDGSEQLVSGYSNVYSASVANEPLISGSRKRLFFDRLDDVSTAISLTEAHPLERGKFYRCDCTKIENTTATTLSDALAEIEAAETFKWWYDSSTHTLYFNRQDSTSVYPIYTGGAGANYLKTRENQSVVLSNLEFRYGCVNLKKLNVAEIFNVSSKCVNAGGAFVYDDSISVLFDHCEAALCYLSSNGDGFNGHATEGVNPFAKYCQATLRECWSHDNLDDGYSDHEYAEATIDGGLYEWNIKAGVTPSYGSHCVCKNVVSRHNYSGFFYAGNATEGNAGQMICYNCLSEANNRGAFANVGGFRVDGTNNKVILIDCKSIGDRNAFSCADTCLMELYDCGYRSQVSQIYVGTGTITKIKTLIAE